MSKAKGLNGNKAAWKATWLLWSIGWRARAGRRGDMVIVCPCPLSPCLATSYADAPMVVYRRQTLQQMFVVPLLRQALCQALGQKQR